MVKIMIINNCLYLNKKQSIGIVLNKLITVNTDF